MFLVLLVYLTTCTDILNVKSVCKERQCICDSLVLVTLIITVWVSDYDFICYLLYLMFFYTNVVKH